MGPWSFGRRRIRGGGGVVVGLGWFSVVILAGGVMGASPCLAEEPRGVLPLPVKARSWRIEDGLPLATSLMTAQDRDGFLWVAGGYGGLYRFDGVKFTPAGNDLVCPVAYPGERNVTCLAAGESGLWIGTLRTGLWRLLEGGWKHFTVANGLSDDRVTALSIDGRGNLWVGTAAGLDRFHGGSIRAYRLADGIPTSPIRRVLSDRRGWVWVATEDGELLRKRGEGFERIPRLEGWGPEAIDVLYEGRDGAVWVGIWCGGLARFQDDGIRIYREREGLDGAVVFALAEDRWGSLWIGARGGLFVLKRATGSEPGVVRKLSGETTFSLFRDHEGAIWAGTASGLDQYRDWRLPVYSDTQGLPGHNISSVLPAKGGGVWIAVGSKGVVLLEGGKVKRHLERLQGLSTNDVTALEQRRDGGLWIGTWGHGVSRVGDDRIIPYPPYGVNPSDVVRSMLKDWRGDLWVGTWGSGLRRYHQGVATTWTMADGLLDDRVRVLLEDGDAVWIATHNGLNRFENGQLERFTTREGLSENSVFALHKGSDGSLWIGTWGGGLNRLKDGRVRVYTTREGLTCNTICSILEDGQGGLWFGCVKGIFRVRLEEFDALDRGLVGALGATEFGKAEGMISTQCNRGTQPAACRTADGRLWFATIQGLVMIDPARLPDPPAPPRAFIMAIEDQKRPLDAPAAAALTHGPRELTFRYATSSVLAPEKIRFQYQLAGFNGDWIEAGAERVARFSNLPAGRYSFQVRARHGDGPWGAAATSFPLEIAPALHQTTWFRAVAACLALAVVALAVRLRLVRIEAHERMLEALVEERTAQARAAQEAAEQASSAKDHFLAVLSHELRTPLTPVLLSVDCMLDDVLDLDQRDQLEMIKRNIQLEARLVDDLLDLSRIERGNLRLDIAVVDVHEAILRAVDVCSSEVQCAGLVLSTSLRAKTHHVRADFARLMQLFWNLIRNSVKFTPPGGAMSITTRALGEADGDSGVLLVVEFHDTGIGIEPHLLERIFDPFEQAAPLGRGRMGGLGLGLAISRWVAESIGGKLTASSAGVGQGATFRLELPAVVRGADRAIGPAMNAPYEAPGDLAVLLVEDNLDTLRYLKIVLERLGHRVVAAALISEARVAAANGSFDLLVCDIQLPDGSGLDLMRELAESSALVGVALSGFGTEEDLVESKAAGFTLHLVKPIVADELEQALCSIGRLLRRPAHAAFVGAAPAN